MIHEIDWLPSLDKAVAFRRSLRDKLGIRLRDELHAAHWIHKPGDVAHVPKYQRLLALRDVVDFVAELETVTIINVIVDKEDRDCRDAQEVFDRAWGAMIQRFHTAISRNSLYRSTETADRGMVMVDRTDEKALRNLVRRLRRYNPIPSQYSTQPVQDPLGLLVEDPVHRDSAHSYWIQLVDVCCFFLYQKFAPNKYMRKKGARNWFNRLNPVLLTQASRRDPQGIVRA